MVIGDRGGERNGDVAVPAARPQVQVDPEHVPFGSRTGDEAGHVRGQAREKLLVADGRGTRRVCAGRLTVPGEHVHEIDVAAVVELRAPQFPESQDCEGGCFQVALIVAAGRTAVACLERGARQKERPVQEHVGQERQGARDGRQVRQRQEIGERDA